MPSTTFSSVLEPLLADVADLVGAHEQGRTGSVGRQWNLAGLNRAIVVMSVSAWESYVENVADEAVDAIRPTTPQLGVWPSLKASVSSARGRFNTPNAENVKHYLRDALGLADVTDGWVWRNMTAPRARVLLNGLLQLRHQIAHGTHPRPTVNHKYASNSPEFVRRLAKGTDVAIAAHLTKVLGVPIVW